MGESEREAFQAINKNREIHQQFVIQYHGKIVKELGDGLLSVFENGTEAVQCAIKIQQAAGKDKIPLRIGIHEGEVVFENGDVFGDGVNLASRIQAEAIPGGICISDTMYRIIKNKEEFKVQSIGKKYLRNVEENINLYQLNASGINTKTIRNRYSIHWRIIGISILIGVAIGIGINYLFLKNRIENQNMIELRTSIQPFTETGGLTSSPSWSPDGEWITYSSNETGNMEIWKKKLEGGELYRITNSSFNETDPAWSPCGHYIAYTTNNGIGISVLSSIGGTPIQISSIGRSPFWSPDSKYFGFEWEDGIFISEFKGGSKPFRIVKGITAKSYASWSPNGQAIIFWDRTQRKIQKLSLADTTISSIYILPSGEEISGISFSEERQKMLLSIGPFGGTKDLYEADIDLESLTLLDDPIPISVTTTDDIDVTISPSGNEVAFTARSIERHLWQFPIDKISGDLIEKKGKKITETGRLNYYPSSTMDGSMIIWTSHRSGMGQLYLKDLNSNKIQKVTTEWGRNIREVFACFGDNSQVYFSSTTGGSYQLWQVFFVGSVGLKITTTKNPTSDAGPIVSLDGQSLIFYSNQRGNFDIWRVNLDGSEREPITDWPSNEIYPILKPNENTIAFVSDKNGNLDLWEMNLDNKNTYPLIDENSMEGWCSWSQDGKWLYYVTNKDGRFNIWKMSLESGVKEQLTNYKSSDYGLPNEILYTKFSVSKNSLILPLEKRTGDIYILSL
jgi:Tol biopolymer transport system component